MLELMINKERVEMEVPHLAGLLHAVEGTLELKGPDAGVMGPQMSPWSSWSGGRSSLGSFQREGFRVSFPWAHASHAPTLFVSLVQTSCHVSRGNILLNIVAPG